jgi:hypothetical protein
MSSNLIRALVAVGMLLLLAGAGQAQEIRYSWLDMSFTGQDVGRSGSLPTPGVPDQIVTVNADSGSGIRFRGSFGTWYGFYVMLDYASSDIELDGNVSNPDVPPAEFDDEFDFTSIRGGLGYKYSVLEKTDLFAEISYDSLDFDFGSFAGENFDMNRQEVGGTLGVRHLFGDHLTTQLHVRYWGVGDADLTTGFFDNDVLVGLGAYWEIVRGFSLVADFESGEFSSWSIGFRLDLDED